MPTHFSTAEGSPFDRRILLRRRRFETPKLIITHDGNVSSAANENQDRNRFMDASPIGQDSNNDIPQFIHVQNSRRLRLNQQRAEREERQPVQRNEFRNVSDQIEERCPDDSFRVRVRVRDEDAQPSPRSSQHRSFCESRVSAISSSRRLNYGMGHSRKPASPSNRGSTNTTRIIATRNEEVGNGEWNEHFPHRESSSPQLSFRQHHPQSSFYTATRSDRDTASSGLRNVPDKYTHCDPISTSRLLYQQNDTTSQCSKTSLPVHSPKKLSVVNLDDKNYLAEDLSSLTQGVGKNPTASIGCANPVATRLFRNNRSQNQATFKGERRTARANGRKDNPGDETVISYNENSNGIYCEVQYRSTQTTEATSKDSKRSKKWLCDVCKEVRFDSYVEAFRHEIECRKKNAPVDEDCSNLDDKQGESNDDRSSQMDTEKRAMRREQIKNRLKEMRLSKGFGNNVCNVATMGRGRSQASVSSANSATKWLCSVCKKVSFDRYADACKHEMVCKIMMEEKVCKIRMGATADTREPANNQGNDESRLIQTEPREIIIIPTQESSDDTNDGDASSDTQSKAFETSTRKGEAYGRMIQSIEETRKNYSVGYNTYNTNIEQRPQQRHICSVCKKVSFDCYSDACQHEKVCKIKMEATADMREPTNNRGNEKSPRIQTELREIIIITEESSNDTNDGDVLSDAQSKMFETREGEADGQIIRCIEETGKEYTNGYNAYNTHTEQDPKQDQFYNSRQRNKGNAYDRYIFLANQAEDEAERERYISLAIQTREEEMSSYKKDEINEERYVCLA
eukprot:jgi/Psemu1/290288/fgenesh1_pg.477_\